MEYVFGGRSAAYPQADTPTTRQVFGTDYGRKKVPFMTEPTEAECFEAEQELLFDVHFRQLDREIRKMIEQDKQKGAKNTEQKLNLTSPNGLAG